MHKLAKNDKENFSIIIPTAGVGRRMKSYGPKSLIKLENHRTILSNQLKIVRDTFENYEVILVVGFEADKIMNYADKSIIKVENENYNETNTLRSIGMGLRAVSTSNVIVIYGDLVFNKETIKNLPTQKSGLLINDSGYMDSNEVGCMITNKRIEHVLPDLPNTWSQIMVLRDNELDIVKKIAWNRNNKHLLGFEGINMAIEQSGKFAPLYSIDMKCVDIDSAKDLTSAKEILEIK